MIGKYDLGFVTFAINSVFVFTKLDSIQPGQLGWSLRANKQLDLYLYLA